MTTAALQSPAEATYWLIQGRTLFLLIHLFGTALFCYIVSKRLNPLFHAQRDFRLDRPWLRVEKVLQFWLGQWRHPRYPLAGSIHILVFAGFLLLATRAFSLILGFSGKLAGIGSFALVYDGFRAHATPFVFICIG